MAQKVKEYRPRLLADIPYLGEKEPGAPRMDAWLPMKAIANTPACILIHGGGWTTGDKADEREKAMAEDLCEMGYAVFSINYHMARYENGPYKGKRIECAWPGCVMDCMDAVSYVRASAGHFLVDPDRICAVGSSAGGHLALLLATMGQEHPLQQMRRYSQTPCRISGAVSLYGVPDIVEWGGELLMPEAYGRMPKEWLLASPAAQPVVEPPPILLIHGDADETVDVSQSERFYRRLIRKGCLARLMVVKGGKHSFDFGVLDYAQREELSGFLKTCFGRE